ncbi:hypothetical protein [Chryseobacterium sp. T1]
MTIIYSNKVNYLLIFLILALLYCDIIIKDVLLTDDLGRVFDPLFGTKNYNFFSFISNFIDQETMTSRPVSGFFYGFTLYLTQFNINFYYINFLFFLLSTYSVYNLTLRISNKKIALLVTIVYIMLPIASSTVFSPIMVNSSLATIFFCLSIEKAISKKLISSSILFILSILSYEIFIPLILIYFFTINSKTKIKLLFILTTLTIVFLYREIVEPNIFNNYYHRSKPTNIFNIKRNLSIFHEITKIPYYSSIAVAKGIRAIYFFSLLDYILLMLIMLISTITVFKTKKLSNFPNKKIFFLLICCITLSFFIFFLSSYRPNIYGFDNRNLGAIKLFSSIISLNCILMIRSNTMRNITLLFIIFIISITNISTKNAWIYSAELNNKIFTSLKKALPKDMESKYIFIKFNEQSETKFDDRYSIYKDKHFVLREPIFLERWESAYLKKINNIPQYYNVNYYYDGYYDTLKKELKYFYIFDYKSNKLKLINHIN